MSIINNDDHILVESAAGMNFWDIMEGISKLFSMPEFKEKNDIWLFRDGQLKIMYSDLYSIKDLVEKVYPADSKGKKTAIVAHTGVQHGLATLYSDLARDLPREKKVFSDLKSATDWIRS
jgi:hypothetical protein